MISLNPALSDWPGTGSLIVAFSGGADSLCLLHQLCLQAPQRPVVAAHIDHGLDAGSGQRAQQAKTLATALNVDFVCVRLQLSLNANIEAEARQARYEALRQLMRDDDVLVTAHHADDVAETLLLRLLRGSGIEGLAGIQACQAFAPGWLIRPLLRTSRQDIETYLREQALPWQNDPTNLDLGLDRNHLRHCILPSLNERFAGASEALNRSAALNREAALALNELAAQDLAMVQDHAAKLSLTRLRSLSAFRQAQVIRHWVRSNGYPTPPGKPLQEFVRQLNEAAADRHPQLRWQHLSLQVEQRALWLHQTNTDSVPGLHFLA